MVVSHDYVLLSLQYRREIVKIQIVKTARPRPPISFIPQFSSNVKSSEIIFMLVSCHYISWSASKPKALYTSNVFLNTHFGVTIFLSLAQFQMMMARIGKTLLTALMVISLLATWGIGGGSSGPSTGGWTATALTYSSSGHAYEDRPPSSTSDNYVPRLRPDFSFADIPCDLSRGAGVCEKPGKAYPW